MYKLSYFVFLLVFNLQAQVSDFNQVNFKKADSIARNLNGASLSNLPILAYRLTGDLDSEVEKLRAIYMWICHNIKNDYGLYALNMKKRRKYKDDSFALADWNEFFKEKTLTRLLKQKRTICTGYAYLLQKLSVFAGLECKMIHGYGRTVSTNIDVLSIPNHSWNVVQLNGKWYLVDPTWSSGYFNFEEKQFIPSFNEGYFLTDPNLFIKSHYPLDFQWALTDTDFTIDEFLTGPLVYGNSFKHDIIPVSPLKMRFEVEQNEKFKFQFEVVDKTNIHHVSLLLADSGKTLNAEMSFNKKENLLEVETFIKHRGIYDIHVLVKEDIVATFVVKVRKSQIKNHN
ncbi:transglutaminase domain-containing protein [Seonamhaeicola sp. ML3]|uniref:transglutaminase domain-containing protein n=1 Tax=Seonamhaeicola sp. ML3 TaxID=2937786 RepID=UPI00200CB9D7|nr:transglutaminase domain-containing protein [Seonamhaeicola sp. ML3]